MLVTSSIGATDLNSFRRSIFMNSDAWLYLKLIHIQQANNFHIWLNNKAESNCQKFLWLSQQLMLQVNPYQCKKCQETMEIFCKQHSLLHTVHLFDLLFLHILLPKIIVLYVIKQEKSQVKTHIISHLLQHYIIKSWKKLINFLFALFGGM